MMFVKVVIKRRNVKMHEDTGVPSHLLSHRLIAGDTHFDRFMFETTHMYDVMCVEC